MDKVSMSHLISFSIYQTKCVIKFLFKDLITLGSISKTMASREKKGERQKYKYKKSFFDEIKNIFHNF